MKIGFGKGTISFPAEMFPTESFCGIHDDPHVRMMIIDDLAAIAVMELVNVPGYAVEACRKAMHKTFGVPYEQCLVHMTHAITTPHEPGPMGPPDRRPPLTEEDMVKRGLFSAAINAAVDEAVEGAKASMTECTIGVGKGECYANMNRDVETPIGWWTGLGSTGPSDREMTVIRANDAQGKPVGMFVSYGIKPCAIDNSEMEKGTRLVSSECCGMACNKAEELYGCPVMFAMSAAGDQIPAKATWYEEVVDGKVVKHDDGVEYGFKCAEEIADMMCGSIKSIADGIECTVIEAKTGTASAALEGELMDPSGRGPSLTAEYKANGKTRPLPVDVVRVGSICFVAEQPELNAVTGMALKDACPGADVVLMSMVNTGFKYLPDITGYERVTFEAKRAGYMPGTAEKWVELAAATVNGLMAE